MEGRRPKRGDTTRLNRADLEEITIEKLHGTSPFAGLLGDMAIDCSRCCALCCVALYFAKLEGFPADKEPGVPCPKLLPDYRCAIHSRLGQSGLKGCMAFDCLGAGQWVAQKLYGPASWRDEPAVAPEMFAVFLKVYRLHQILWYLVEASSLLPAAPLLPEIGALIAENRRLRLLPPTELLATEEEPYRTEVNRVFRQASEAARRTLPTRSQRRGRTDWIGRDFKKADLSGWDFSMALLIAANLRDCRLYGADLMGADLRDANLCGADLRECLFLTQGQINAATGDHRTRLPEYLKPPEAWMRR